MSLEELQNVICKAVSEALQKNAAPEFHFGDVPVPVVARVYGKDPSWVRAGIILGWLPIGIATRKGIQVTDIKQMDSKYGRINYHISPKKLYEETGYIWKGETT